MQQTPPHHPTDSRPVSPPGSPADAAKARVRPSGARPMGSWRRALPWWLLAAVLVLAFAAWGASADEVLDAAREWSLRHRAFVQANAAACWLGMLAAGSVAINCPIPVAALLKVLAGFFFGLEAGVALNVAMSLSGGLAGLAATRHLFYRSLHARFGRTLAKASLEMARNGFWYVLSARLLMVTPFFLVNVAAGLSGIRKRRFLLATGLGVLPSSFIYALTGGRLEQVRTVSDFASSDFALAMGLLAVCAVLPALARRRG
ncbi:hypothetical protein NNJEOMEG_00555 [Fundidesulfovibrio magnetotacticus]|uniref:TVP38/TMEM64 family membrane protein n=2 Tax=Fundidesulfovibrio magnetotacticus TaxID=2730080 RepID=A0A6V8LQW2_9BACT|nr:hypothetical protein NNJEOMEG_00555 [Fundidesulfovibrio magnetotacticus]